jgi:hypothetical protein
MGRHCGRAGDGGDARIQSVEKGIQLLEGLALVAGTNEDLTLITGFVYINEELTEVSDCRIGSQWHEWRGVYKFLHTEMV